MEFHRRDLLAGAAVLIMTQRSGEAAKSARMSLSARKNAFDTSQ